MRVLVIGAGPAGTRAAIRTAAAMPQAQVTLASAEAALPYDRVALSKLLAGDIEVPALITHSARALREARVAYRPATPIAAIDRAAKRAVTTAGEALHYDHLILATGSQAVRLPLPGADLPGVVGYRDLADVRAMLRAAAGWGQAVVIGGGLLDLGHALSALGSMQRVVGPYPAYALVLGIELLVALAALLMLQRVNVRQFRDDTGRSLAKVLTLECS